jgi:hypothetical protein
MGRATSGNKWTYDLTTHRPGVTALRRPNIRIGSATLKEPAMTREILYGPVFVGR